MVLMTRKMSTKRNFVNLLHQQEVYPNLQDDNQSWHQEGWEHLNQVFWAVDKKAEGHISEQDSWLSSLKKYKTWKTNQNQ